MPTPLRIAVLSAWHVHAEEYGRAVQQNPHAELVAVWDDDARRGEDLAATLDVPFVADLDALLEREDLGGVTVTTATSDHLEVIGRALRAGKHVFTEKLLAPTLAECDELIELATRRDLALTVSLPRLFHGYTLALRELLDAGRLGRLTYCRVRLAHDGSVADWLPERFYDPAAAIGGAFSDLAAHPVYLTQLVLGPEATSVRATYTGMTGRGVEDNAVVTLTTPDGAIGVMETGFVTPASPFTIEVHGTAGSLLYGLEPGVLRLRTRDGEERIEVPSDAPTALERWVEDIRTGTRTTETVRRARDLTALVVAANADAARS